MSKTICSYLERRHFAGYKHEIPKICDYRIHFLLDDCLATYWIKIFGDNSGGWVNYHIYYFDQGVVKVSKQTKAILIKCFVSHRPPPRKVGSVGRIKKKSKNYFKVIQFL